MNYPTSLVVACLLSIGAAQPAGASQAEPQGAQHTSRAELLAAARAARAENSTPPDRSRVERLLYWYDNQFVLSKAAQSWHGFHLAGGNFPAGAGFKLGVGYDRLIGSSNPDPDAPNRIEATARAVYSTRGYARLGAGLNLRNLFGVPLDVTTSGQYYEFPQEDFFGIGRSSLEQTRTNYLLNSVDIGAAIRWRPRLLDIGGHVTHLSPRIGRGTDRRFPSTESVFQPRMLPGFIDQPDFVRIGGSVALDWRDNPSHPHIGGRYGVAVTRFTDQDLGRFSFDRIDIDLQQYVPLPNRYRLLAVRATAAFTDPRAGHEVPFFYQPTLGGAQTMRGFREFRFRDLNSVLLSAEYRWEAWWALDPALFIDAGAVAPTRRDLSIRNLEVSYGVGFRLHSNRAFTARMDLAFSREGFVPLLRFEHVF